jgi:hypothetical protein
MKSFLTRISIIVAGATAMALTTPLSAVPLGIDTSFGAVQPATPANDSSEVNFINNLRSISHVGQNAPSYPPLLDDGTFANTGANLYDRFDTVIPAGPEATTVGGMQGQSPGTINLGAVGSWFYLLGKFGNTSYVWYVGHLGGEIDLPTTLGAGGGLSHYSLYNPATTSVPEGGTTVALLGLALGLLALARRKFVI